MLESQFQYWKTEFNTGESGSVPEGLIRIAEGPPGSVPEGPGAVDAPGPLPPKQTRLVEISLPVPDRQPGCRASRV